MRPIPINSAEAIFEPFFEPSLSEFNQWQTETPGVTGLKFTPGWSFVTFNWEQPAPDGLVLRVQRRYEALDCRDYDRVLVCLNLPEDSVISLAVETDAGPRARIGRPCGATRHEEWVALDGAQRIHSLTVEVRHPHPVASSGWLMWFGLQSTTRLPFHLKQWAGYDERWEKYLQPAEFEPAFKPAYGLMVNAEELEEVRRKFADSPATRELRQLSEKARSTPPEPLIGEYVNFWNFNVFRRERDMGKQIMLHGPFAAQAGLLWKDKALCRLAARYALSLAHCDHWDDIFFAHLRGGNWDQRGFSHALIGWECAMILDMCGEWFTPLGRNLILRKLATEAHGGMSHASWWWEYMYHTNQLCGITPGRLYSLLVLERCMPVSLGHYPKPADRVAPHTDIAWANLLENLGHALLPDGGYVEGASYFSWVAQQTAVSALLYSRGRGQDLRQLVPAPLFRTDRLAEMLLSTDDGQDMILTGDANFVFGEALAFLAWLMPRSHWVTLYRKSVQRAGVAPMLAILRLDREIPARGPELAPFVEMPDLGYMASVRRLGPELVKLFILGNKARGDHQHEDKGSFVLECAGDSFAFDFGCVDYANPIATQLKHAQRHNMLTPWCGTERPAPANPCAIDLKPRGSGDATRFSATIDLTPSWEGWFTRWQRTWDSPAPDTFTLTDEWAVSRGEGAIFHWTTRLPIRLEGRQAIIEGRRATAVLTFPEDVEAQVDEMPLMDPRRTAVEARWEVIQYAWKHAATQPRLTLRQRGRSGTLRVNVKLTLKA
jgi:hypothetical protein